MPYIYGMRRTTIQVHEELLAELDRLKKELRAPSYEAAMLAVIRERRRLPTSYFGIFPGGPSFKREELDRFD
jgi:hypothetical protein